MADQPCLRHQGEEAMLGFRRVLTAFPVSSALILGGSVAASAAGNPGRTPNPSGGPLDINCGGIPAVASITFNKEFAKTYTLADGTVKVMIEGRQLVTVTGTGKGPQLQLQRALCDLLP